VLCVAQAASQFGEHPVGVIKGDAALVVEVEGVQDAVEGFEAPGVQMTGNGGGLEGTFVIAAQEDAGGAAKMTVIRQDSGVPDFPTDGIWTGLAAPIEPISRVSGTG
jgi:hypothetical protein